MIQYNLVLQDRNWVMEKLANHFSKYIPGSQISNKADLQSDINFYFNWHGMVSKTRFDVCYFTHIEDINWWNRISSACDVAISMGKKYLNKLPEDKTIIFYPPPFENFLPQKKTKILVVGRSYQSGRKNLESLDTIRDLDNIELTFTGGRLSEDELKQAYLNTDYILVTSKIEAGPMCVVEAISMNKPVIAPDVGWCWDYPVIKYNNKDDLKSIITKISFNPNSWNERVSEITKKINVKFNEFNF
jgi:glycosyltransferase involved in cell wall biosynthesis